MSDMLPPMHATIHFPSGWGRVVYVRLIAVLAVLLGGSVGRHD